MLILNDLALRLVRLRKEGRKERRDTSNCNIDIILVVILVVIPVIPVVILFDTATLRQLACWSLAQTDKKIFEHELHRQAAGPFIVARAGDKAMLQRPYGALFALHHNDKYVFTCSSTGCKVYEMNGSGLTYVQQFGEHQQQAITLDWAAAGGGGATNSAEEEYCVTSALDGSVGVAKLMLA